MKWIKNNLDMIQTVLVILNIGFLLFSTGMILSMKENEEPVQEQFKVKYIETVRYATEEEQIEHDKKEVEMLAKTVWGEARGAAKTERAAVVWCVLNRVDDDRFPDNITDVITQENQFSGYSENHPVDSEIVELMNDVMTRWVFEKTSIGDVGRVLPKEYCWFKGVNGENIFRDAYNGNYNTWDWSLESPYKEG